MIACLTVDHHDFLNLNPVPVCATSSLACTDLRAHIKVTEI